MGINQTINLRVAGQALLASKLKRLVGLPRQILGVLVAKYALKIQGTARRGVKVDQGITRASIFAHMFSRGLSASIGSDQKTALWIEKGTRPHFPPPDALIPWCRRHGMEPGAEWAVARAIAKRGTKPNPFLEPAFLEHAPDFVAEANKTLADGLTE